MLLNRLKLRGLGAKITEASFRDQFKGQSSSIPLSVVKGIKPEDAIESGIAAISGATISSTSVVNAVNSAKDEAVNLFKNDYVIYILKYNKRLINCYIHFISLLYL
ncbi:FMN-binding protein [Brachyspira hyodysenteriae]|nr:FMN-binding protein [Brachyspira hyodysenteriae]MDA1467315.1 FMN-binding protein [Brachyspira hyodysenteriae]